MGTKLVANYVLKLQTELRKKEGRKEEKASKEYTIVNTHFLAFFSGTKRHFCPRDFQISLRRQALFRLVWTTLWGNFGSTARSTHRHLACKYGTHIEFERISICWWGDIERRKREEI